MSAPFLHADSELFFVQLCDYPGLPDAERLRAERRYAKTLARQCGSDAAVVDTLRLLESLQDASPEEVTADAVQAYHRWTKASRAALEAGLQGLGGDEACYFEVKAAPH